MIPWYYTVEMRRIWFDMRYGRCKKNDARPHGCIWNRYKVWR